MAKRYTVVVMIRGAAVHCIKDRRTGRKHARIGYWRDDYVHVANWLNERENGYPEKRKK